ncbi:MAG: hypothetical protein JRJ04_06685 [Deltaproteobacteria bacterium]|nr:hypothetical protein [Deltaproteobacteria bacterium]
MKKLWEYFTTYLYLPRLKDGEVLIQAIQDGIQQLTWAEHFAYAERYDEEQKRYVGLKAGQLTSVILDDHSVIIKPQVAKKQLEKETEKPIPGKEPGEEEPGEREPYEEKPEKPAKPRRFHGSVKLDATRLGRDAGNIGKEVVQHLSALVGAEVEVTLEISAKIPDGAPDHVIRTVTENCNTLSFATYGFEED